MRDLHIHLKRPPSWAIKPKIETLSNQINLTMAALEAAIQLWKAGMSAGIVYILASQPHGTLYTGITSNLLERMGQYRAGIGSAFVEKYGVKRLVHFEEHPPYADAIRRETSLKRWKRDWKIALIEKANPEWKDLIEN